MSPANDYLTALTAGLRVASRSHGAQRWRRLAYVGAFLTVLPTVWGLTAAGMLLDAIVYPRWREEPLARPVFIVGNHRTGSTFLHRLLARDTETFAVFRLFEMFLPAIVHKRLVRAVGRVDAAVGRPLGRVVDWLDARWANDYRQVHPMGIRLPEEDEYVLFFRLASAAMWETFPDEARFRRHFWQDTDMDPAEADGHLGFYRTMAQRQRYHVGHGVWLSKNRCGTGASRGCGAPSPTRASSTWSGTRARSCRPPPACCGPRSRGWGPSAPRTS
jgi:hypothetical protein